MADPRLIDRIGAGGQPGLPGTGLMLAAQDVLPEQRARFAAWYTHEHLPERLGVDGVYRATRYQRIAASSGPGLLYLAIYEARDPAVFASPGYLGQADAPSALTRSVVADRVRAGTATSRAVLSVRRTLGCGVGRSLALVDLRCAGTGAGLGRGDLGWYDHAILPELAADRRVCGVHLAVLDERATRAKDATAAGRALHGSGTVGTIVFVTGTSAVDELARRTFAPMADRMSCPAAVTAYDYLVSMAGAPEHRPARPTASG